MTRQQFEKILQAKQDIGIIEWRYFNEDVDVEPQGEIIEYHGIKYDIIKLVDDELVDKFIKIKNAKNINSIRKWITFFGIMAVVGLIFEIISLIIQ